MVTYTSKMQITESRSVRNQDSQKLRDNKSSYQITDNRPVTVVQNLLKTKAENSPQSTRERAIQKMAGCMPQNNKSITIQRAIFPVYRRDPSDQEESEKDHREVDGFAARTAADPTAGEIKVGLMTQDGTLEGIPDDERVVVTGHGNAGIIQGYSGTEVATRLKDNWKLPKAYSGTITLSSCKAGDNFLWFGSSLAAAVSQNLQGYSASVMGLKGNVITDSKGKLRSVGSDQKLEEYRELERQLRECEAARKLEVKKQTDGLNFELMKVHTSILLLESKQFTKPKSTMETITTGFSSLIGSGKSLLGMGSEPSEAEELERFKKEKLKLENEIEAEAKKVENTFQPQIDKIHLEMDQAGVPSDNLSVRVEYLAKDRKPTFAEEWVKFLVAEAEKTE